MKEKRDRRTSTSDSVRNEQSVHDSISNRAAALIERNKEKKQETTDFIAHLREKSMVRLAALANDS